LPFSIFLVSSGLSKLFFTASKLLLVASAINTSSWFGFYLKRENVFVAALEVQFLLDKRRSRQGFGTVALSLLRVPNLETALMLKRKVSPFRFCRNYTIPIWLRSHYNANESPNLSQNKKKPERGKAKGKIKTVLSGKKINLRGNKKSFLAKAEKF
jgi:hypothetical protein